MRRELQSVRTGQVLGAVVLDRAGPSFEGRAGEVLAAMRRRLGDTRAAELVIAEGWSNGYLYFADPFEVPSALVAAAAVHTGAMVALVPSKADADRLAVDGGEEVDQLHVTLAYLGDAADIGDDMRTAIVDRLTQVAADKPQITSDGFALNLFNPTNPDQDTCIVLGLTGEDLDVAHGAVHDALRDTGVALPEQHAPWIPHLTLIYTEDADRLATLVDRTGPVTFDRLRVAFAGENTDIPLGAAAVEEVPMPWHIVPNSADCPADEPFAVVKDATGEVEGCHPTEAAAQEQMAALYAAEQENDVSRETPAADYGVVVAPPSVEHFHTVVMEGVSTGLRTFAPQSLTWREPPFAFHWEYSSAAHGGQMMVAQVGVITRVERQGNEVHFWGPLDLKSAEAVEYARRLVDGFSRWSSIGVDESLKDADIEMVFPERDEEEQAEEEEAGLFLFPEPEQIIFHAARIAEVTAVSVPALADATVEPTQALIDTLREMGMIDEAMVAGGHTITIPDLPPAWWFDEPAEEPEIGAITITDEGRLFGWLAPAGVSHRAFRGQRAVFAPRNQDYSEFMNKTAFAEDADGNTVRIAAGNVTMSCEHADPYDSRRQDPSWAGQHYENSCSIFARVRVGESASGGTWIAGPLLPDVSWAQVTRALGCALSGDWQGGKLKAALLVPVEGFPKPHQATVHVREGALVASAVPVRFRRRPAPGGPNLRPVLEAMAKRLGRDSMTRLAALRDRHPTRKATP